MKKIEYRIVSSCTSGINETYKDFGQFKERYNYIKNNQDQFKNNSMIYFYKHTYNEEGKYRSETLSTLDLR